MSERNLGRKISLVKRPRGDSTMTRLRLAAICLVGLALWGLITAGIYAAITVLSQ